MWVPLCCTVVAEHAIDCHGCVVFEFNNNNSNCLQNKTLSRDVVSS